MMHTEGWVKACLLALQPMSCLTCNYAWTPCLTVAGWDPFFCQSWQQLAGAEHRAGPYRSRQKIIEIFHYLWKNHISVLSLKWSAIKQHKQSVPRSLTVRNRKTAWPCFSLKTTAHAQSTLHYSEMALTGNPSSKVWVAPPRRELLSPVAGSKWFVYWTSETCWKCVKCRSPTGLPPPQSWV